MLDNNVCLAPWIGLFGVNDGQHRPQQDSFSRIDDGITRINVSLLRIFLNTGLTVFPTKKSGPEHCRTLPNDVSEVRDTNEKEST
jgi:hypothetical protein